MPAKSWESTSLTTSSSASFGVGGVFEVGTTLDNYLLAWGAAVPVIDGRPVHTIPKTEARSPTKRDQADADDGSTRPRKKKPPTI